MDQVNELMLITDTRITAYKALVLEIAKNFEDVVLIKVLREENEGGLACC